MTDEAYWYVIRTSGLAAWFGAGMSILLGILAASRIGRRRIRSRSIVLLHRWLSAATISLLFVHVGALFPETYANFGAGEIFIPFAADWRTNGLAGGIIAMYLMIVVYGTSLAMRWIPRPLWKGVHALSYLVFALATYHAISVGSDVSHTGVVAAGAATIWTFLLGVGVRATYREAAQSANGLGPPPSTVITDTPADVGPGSNRAGARNMSGDLEVDGKRLAFERSPSRYTQRSAPGMTYVVNGVEGRLGYIEDVLICVDHTHVAGVAHLGLSPSVRPSVPVPCLPGSD